MTFAVELQSAAETLPRRGELSDTPFPVLLGRARLAQATGVVSISSERFLYLLRGTPIHVGSLLEDEASIVFIRQRLSEAIGEDKLAKAGAIAAAAGGGVGEALLTLGFLDPNQLFDLKRAHSHQRLVSFFSLRKAPFEFEPFERFGPELVPIPLDTVEVLREGLGRHYDALRLERELRVHEHYRVFVIPGAAPQTLTTEESRLLTRASSRLTVRSLFALGGRPDDLRRRLFLLYCLGLVGFEAEPAEPDGSRKSQHPFAVPPVKARRAAPSAPAPPIPSEARSVPKTPPPRTSTIPAPPRPTTEPRRPTLTPPLRSTTVPPPPRPSTAPSPAATLTPPARTTPAPTTKGGDGTGQLDTARATAAANEAVDAAELARAGGNLLEAVEIVRTFNKNRPGDPEVMAHLGLLLVLVDPRLHAKEALKLAREARAANGALALPYVVMGILLEQMDEIEEAVQMYRKALSREPECSDATRQLSRLGRD